MTNIITSISLNLNHLKIASPISALEHADFEAMDKITYIVRKKVTFSTPSTVAPHCSLQWGITQTAAAVGSRPRAPPYTNSPRLPHYWKAFEDSTISGQPD